MVVHRRKKVLKYRGHTTHGAGSRKKRRGAGSRGGRGRAGSGKRAGHKKYGIVLGKEGFLPRRQQEPLRAINIGYFTADRVQLLVHTGKATKEKDYVVLQLPDLGYDKLLGAGHIDLKLRIHVPYCSAQAAEKVKAAGGEVVSSVPAAP